MACVLKRCRSTIFRELKRNRFSGPCLPKCDGYYGAAASLMTTDRRARQRKLLRHPGLCSRGIERLKNGWTPAQIGNRMIHEKAPLRVCQETICRFIYSKEGKCCDLWWYLPNRRTARRPRRARKRLPPKFHPRIFTVTSASCCAPTLSTSGAGSAIGDGDLMRFKQELGQNNVTSLVEPVSRFTVRLKNPGRYTKPVMAAIRDMPHPARRSITFDRGTAFVSWPHLQAEIGTQTWFCDPSPPWQKGTVETTNRRVRRWLPRQRDIRTLTDHDMKVICDRLNNPRRKCRGWRTPAEVFREKMMTEMK